MEIWHFQVLPATLLKSFLLLSVHLSTAPHSIPSLHVFNLDSAFFFTTSTLSQVSLMTCDILRKSVMEQLSVKHSTIGGTESEKTS